MTPATTLEPWFKVGVHALAVDPYSDAAILFYNFRHEQEALIGGTLRYILRELM